MSLLKGDAEYLLALQGLRLIIRIDLDDIVVTVFLGLKDFQGFRLISRGDNAVRHLPLNDSGRVRVAHIGQRDKVPEGGHAVCSPCPCIGAGQR